MTTWSDGQTLNASPLNSNFIKSYKLLASDFVGGSTSVTTAYTLLSTATVASGSIADSITVGVDVAVAAVSQLGSPSYSESATYAIRKWTSATGEIDIVTDYSPAALSVESTNSRLSFSGRTTVVQTTIALTADASTVVAIRVYGKSSGTGYNVRTARVYNTWVYGG